ncbi:PIN domain-containing protein [Dyadobacter sp. CY356]|uniref:PIN domain-containing protein n=1 Tax=Dyadobacter sp. CY356 TaxID=2906442 RepID=UPI001F2FA31E|nr:PIN domain-containing protein [Dyadobacter sp. CY356]MCF0057258.1 PIN domain-containing protein [Dyadobacter sp. CY356]
MRKVIIDTDIILDFFFERQPFSDNAVKIFSLLESGEVQGFVTPLIYSNVYYLLIKMASHNYVTDKLKLLFQITDVLTMGKNTVLQALNSDFSDFEDALQNFSAADHNEINVLITRNVKDYKNSKMAVLTPDSFLKIRENN